MSLPQRPWPAERIFRLRERAVEMDVRSMTKHGKYKRLRKRAFRLVSRWIALWMQLKEIDPHRPASLTDIGYGTRKPHR